MKITSRANCFSSALIDLLGSKPINGEDMILPTMNNTPKRIYLCNSILMTHDCPECKKENRYQNNVPFVSYGDYCHVFYCSECGHETTDKMYTLNSVGDDYVDITPSKLHNLKFFEYKWVEKTA